MDTTSSAGAMGSPAQTASATSTARPRPGTPPLIELRGATKRFGDSTALDRVDLCVKSGEVVVIVGPSGGGKSTLCRCINGLEPIHEGDILIDGQPLPREGRALASVRAELGMVFQNFALFQHMTILENVTLAPIRTRRSTKTKAYARAGDLLATVGIAEHKDKYPYQLSGGQQQRAAIVRSLMMEPKALLLDEPTSALDPEMIKEVLDVMLSLAHGGMTMVVVSHELGFAKLAADRVLFMDTGRIVEDATPNQFFTAPTSARARDFLSKVLH